MSVSFKRIVIGGAYTRPELASMWGYAGYEAISRGAITPRGIPLIILFITREKQHSLTPYEDRLENGVLEIEGETNHVADSRIVNAKKAGDQIHLFYRERHHSPFLYYGQIHLIKYAIHSNTPSHFVFFVESERPDQLLQTELITHGQPNESFLADEEGRRMIREHVSYERSPRNRRRALRIHGNVCVACGFSFDENYGAAHAKGYIEFHHIRPLAKGRGRVNPVTDLVPLCSNCHSMAHRKSGQILTVEQIQSLLRGPQ